MNTESIDQCGCTCCNEQYDKSLGNYSDYNLPEVRQDHLLQFLQFLETDRIVRLFMEFDRCCLRLDKYLLAMVFKYFMRINIHPKFYTKELFFCALNIALDVCEDGSKELTRTVYVWSTELGTSNNQDVLIKYRTYKLKFCMDLKWKTLICKAWCDQLFMLAPANPAFQRTREEGHEGAHKHKRQLIEGKYYYERNFGICSRC